MPGNTRFGKGDVTETLVTATERASEMDATDVLVILYKRPPESSDCFIKTVYSENLTIETANWLLDKIKDRLIREDK